MHEHFPSGNDQREQAHTIYRLMVEQGPRKAMEMLGDYSVVINGDPEGESWIGISSWEKIEPDHAEKQQFPQFIWKLDQDGTVAFYRQEPGGDEGIRYRGGKPATNVDALLVHVFNLVEKKRENPGTDSPKFHEKYNKLVTKLIDHSQHRAPRRLDVWE